MAASGVNYLVQLSMFFAVYAPMCSHSTSLSLQGEGGKPRKEFNPFNQGKRITHKLNTLIVNGKPPPEFTNKFLKFQDRLARNHRKTRKSEHFYDLRSLSVKTQTKAQQGAKLHHWFKRESGSLTADSVNPKQITHKAVETTVKNTEVKQATSIDTKRTTVTLTMGHNNSTMTSINTTEAYKSDYVGGYFMFLQHSHDAAVASLCLAGLMLLLFAAVCYSRMWRKRVKYDEDFQEERNMLPLRDILQSRARFLPMFKRFFNSKQTRHYQSNDYIPLATNDTYDSPEEDEIYNTPV